MNKKERERHKKKLLALRQRLTGEVSNLEESFLKQSLKEQAGDLSGYGFHLADAASDAYEQEFSLSIASREQETVNDIDEALARIDSGEFGKCERCEQVIGSERLKAIPYARLCLACKQQEELKQ